MSTMRLDIVTPDATVFSDEVTFILAKGVEGDLGILPQHMPLVTLLKDGPVTIKQEDREQVVHLRGAFLEVRKDRVTILAEAAEWPGR